MTDDTQPEAREFTMSQYASKDDMIGAMHTRIAELESELEAMDAGGVQALSAAPGVTSEQRRLIGVIADKIEDGTLFQSGIYQKKDLARFVRNMLDTTPTAPAASPTPPAELQAAPKAAQGVGNSGFDHKTAADLLNNKTVSDEAVRKFVATSRWAHDEKAALSAMLLSVRGVLASREAEIALLKKALMDAESAPQPPPTPQADSQLAPQGETNVQLDTDSNSPTPGQQRDVAGPVAVGQPLGHGSDSTAGDPSAQRNKLLTVAERNIRSFLRSAVFKSESDREAAVEREQERIAFKDAHRHLELYEVPDAWGRPMFKHSHVEASWLGWLARASHGQAPATQQDA